MQVATASSAGISNRRVEDGVGVRAIQSCTSDDFIHWTTPEHHVYEEGVPFEHFYTNATTLCPGAEHILLSFPMRFVPERTKDTEGMDYPGGGISDAVFMTSRDGVHWDRTFMDAWLRAGLDQRNWDPPQPDTGRGDHSDGRRTNGPCMSPSTTDGTPTPYEG